MLATSLPDVTGQTRYPALCERTAIRLREPVSKNAHAGVWLIGHRRMSLAKKLSQAGWSPPVPPSAAPLALCAGIPGALST